MKDEKRIDFSQSEVRSLKLKETRVYLQSVMRKIFQSGWEDHLKKLLTGDRVTLDLCAKQLTKNLNFFPLLHTLCLVTGRRDDLDEKDPAKAADHWLTWYSEHQDHLVWDPSAEIWRVEIGSTRG